MYQTTWQILLKRMEGKTIKEVKDHDGCSGTAVEFIFTDGETITLDFDYDEVEVSIQGLDANGEKL